MNLIEKNPETILRELGNAIITTFRDVVTSEETCDDQAEELGKLLRLYEEFHLFTDEMLPDRATDFSDTCDAIRENLTDWQWAACRRAFLEAEVQLPERPRSVPPLPFLSALTVNRLTPSRHAFEAAVITRLPKRR